MTTRHAWQPAGAAITSGLGRHPTDPLEYTVTNHTDQHEHREEPAVDRSALRDRIAEALMRWAERNNDPQYAAIRRSAVVRANAYSRADAVLAVLAADGSAGRVADDTQPETLRPATTEWTFEACYDADNDKWHGIGGTYSAHAEAKDAFKRRAENDSGHVKHFRFRLVRATTTYTVEDERTPPPTPPAVGGAQQPQED